MHTTASIIAAFAGAFLSIFLCFLPREGAQRTKEHVRRMAEHRMNARLLKLNL